MCGIAGIVETDGAAAASLRDAVVGMCASLVHRGPDDGGQWVDESAGVALGHRRLAILDLSPRGHQPMASPSGRYVIVYNGEIYNFRSVRTELEQAGHRLTSDSDTEVLLTAIEAWGLRAALRRCNGMFAFALWDRAQRELHLARDRVGKKPLYYGWIGRRLVFASELHAIRSLAGFDAEIDREALAAYLRFNAVPGTRSIYRGIAKVEPGGVRTLRIADPSRALALDRYWSARDAVSRAREAPASESDLGELHTLLRDAVSIRMESDVPLGAFLSGGVDSSLVGALMQAQSTAPVKTFTIGFDVAGYDEAQHAAAVARHLGTEHTELYLTAQDARDAIPLLPQIYDEPFCDVSQIPTYLVSRLARQHVTVSLSGDGGDELFAGYQRYPFFAKLWRLFSPIPGGARHAMARVLGTLMDRGALDRLDWLRLARTMDRDRWMLLHGLLRTSSQAEFYRYLISVWRDREPVVRSEPPSLLPPLVGLEPIPEHLTEPVELASYLDLVGYLVDDILVKVDRASMAVSLEARAPLLDYRVVEWSWRLPISVKNKGGLPKWPLQSLLWEYVPRQLVDRPKMGFGVPIGEWLRGPLRSWGDDLFSTTKLRREGYFDPDLVARRWSQHRNGDRNWAPELWAIAMFEAWHDRHHIGSATSQYKLQSAPSLVGSW